LPPQLLCLASLPTNPKASSPALCSHLSFPCGRNLLRPGHGFCRIPFRITSFAYPHHLTLIESYSYKNRGRGWGHSLSAEFPNAFLHSATFNSHRIRTSAKLALLAQSEREGSTVSTQLHSQEATQRPFAKNAKIVSYLGGDSVSTEAVAARRHAGTHLPVTWWKLEMPTTTWHLLLN
jgi:hypothetical protein